MTRRTLISGAPALLLHRVLEAQRRGAPIELRERIPTGPVARWNFHRFGQMTDECGTVAGVPDDSGNGNSLSINTAYTKQSPMFTLKSVNGRGGYWAGAQAPTPATAETPSCGQTGCFVSPNISLVENQISVLFCGEFGSNGNPNGDATMMQLGNVYLRARGQNGRFPRDLLWYNYTSGHGNPDIITPQQLFCGPVCGAVVSGWGGGNTSYVMTNRTRGTTVSGWSASGTGTSWNAPVYVGNGSSANSPCGCIWHEIAIYNRVLTAAELDLWQVYCNQMYSTPLCLSANPLAYVDRRVVFFGDSNTDGQNATRAQAMPNVVAGLLGNWNHVEYINYGVGSSQIANHISTSPNNLAYETGLYDPALGKNIAVYTGGYHNDYAAALTYTQCYTNLTAWISAMRAAGFKVIVGTSDWNSTTTSTESQWHQSLNALILANSAGADAVIDSTPTGIDPGFLAWKVANVTGHMPDAGYTRWAAIIAPVVNSLL